MIKLTLKILGKKYGMQLLYDSFFNFRCQPKRLDMLVWPPLREQFAIEECKVTEEELCHLICMTHP